MIITGGRLLTLSGAGLFFVGTREGDFVKTWLLVLLTFTAAHAGELPPIDTHAGWPVRELPAEAPAEVTLTPRVAWSLTFGEDSEPLVGRLQHAAPGRDGLVYLVDSQMGRVLQVSAAGEIETVRGRAGEGPGEFDGLYRAVELPDGRLGVVGGAAAPTLILGGRGDLVLIDDRDEPAGVWPLAGDPGTVPVVTIRDLRAAGERLLVVSDRSQVSPPLMIQIRELALVSAPEGAREVLARRLWTTEFTDRRWHERDQFEPYAYGRCDLSVAGRVAFAPTRDRWLLAVRELEGSGVVWRRPLVGVERGEAGRDEAREAMGEQATVCDRDPVIGRVRWRPDGRLWVEPWGISPRPGCVACFDELTSDGELVRRVHLAVDGDPDHGTLHLMADGRLVWLEGFGRRDEEFVGEPRAVLLII